MPELSGAPGIWVLHRHVINQLTLVGANGINVAGEARIFLGTVPAGMYYEVERIVADTVNCADFTLYTPDDAGNSNIREHALVTADPILVFDESSLIRFFPNEQIIAVMTGGVATVQQPLVVMQVQVIMWRSTFIPDELGPGVKITRGLEHGPDSDSPDPGGWN